MNKTIKTLIGTIALISVLNTPVLANMPQGTVVIGESSYNLAYANNPSNTSEITNAVVNSQGKIYIKDFSGNWIDNTTGKTIDKNVIPEVTYKDENGKVTRYEEHDGDEMEDNTEETTVFDDPELDKYLTTDRVDVEGENIYITYAGVEHYLPHSDFNPNLNKQIYDLTKFLLEDNERGNYVKIGYTPINEDFDNSKIGIFLKESIKAPIDIFNFAFEESSLEGNVENAPVYLNIYLLSDIASRDEGRANGNSFEMHYFTPYYMDKLKESIKVLFPNKDYEGIYEYVMEQYTIRTECSDPFRREKVIGDMTVVAHYTQSGKLYFYFRY